MIVGLVSSYDEGPLLGGAVASLVPACDLVGVFEGPIGSGHIQWVDATPWSTDPAIHVANVRRYPDAATKRTKALEWAKSRRAEWVVWLDGDELLLWGEYLPDMIGRADLEQNAVGGFPLRIVELDGSVGYSYNRVLRVEHVRRYLHDAYQAELANGMVVALPNEKVCGAGGVPWGAFPHQQLPDGTLVPVQDPADERVQRFLARHRPPVAGEPHVLHRSMLRDPGRAVPRQSDVEAEWFNG